MFLNPTFIQTKISDVSFPTSLNSFSHETNEQPIPATGSRDHKALPYIRAKWLEFNFKVVKTTFSSCILPCKSEPLSTFCCFWTFSADTPTIIACHVGVFRGVVFPHSPQT